MRKTNLDHNVIAHLTNLPIEELRKEWASVQEKLASHASLYKGQKISRDTNLLKGLLFDAQGTPYTPGYTAKGKKQYRYYISQNLIQMRDHLDNVLGRFPAHEIETAVESILHGHLGNHANIIQLLDLCPDLDAETIQQVIKAQSTIPFSQFVQGIIQRIIIQPDSIEIELNTEEFCQALSETSGVKIKPSKEMALIVGAYNTRRAKKSAIVIEPEKSNRDIFDLPPDQLKKLVQGFIWREEHFRGLTIRQIADRAGLSDVYVGKQIFATFEIDQVAS